MTIAILFGGFLMFAAFAALALHLNKRAIRRLLGYRLFIDLAGHGGVLFLAIHTGTISGLLDAEMAMILMSLTMWALVKLFGFERLGTRGWIRHPGLLA